MGQSCPSGGQPAGPGRSGPAAPAPVLPAIRSGWPEPGQLVRTGALAGQMTALL